MHGEGLSSHAHLRCHFLAWCCPIPELSLEEQAVLSPQPLSLRLGQGVLDLQGRALAPCLAEITAGGRSAAAAEACRPWALLLPRSSQQGPSGLPLTVSLLVSGHGCGASLGEGSSSEPCPAFPRAWLSPPWLLSLAAAPGWGEGRRMRGLWQG